MALPARKAAVQVALRRHFGIQHDDLVLETNEYLAMILSRPTADYAMFSRICERIGAQPPTERSFQWLVHQASDVIPGHPAGRASNPYAVLAPVIVLGMISFVMLTLTMTGLPWLMPYAALSLVALIPASIYAFLRQRPRRSHRPHGAASRAATGSAFEWHPRGRQRTGRTAKHKAAVRGRSY